MKYFVLKQDKQVGEIKDYRKQPDIDKDFARFIRREALHAVLIEQSNNKPGYLQYANKLGLPMYEINGANWIDLLVRRYYSIGNHNVS